MSTFTAAREVFTSLFLTELLKGMRVTGKHFLAKNITIQFP